MDPIQIVLLKLIWAKFESGRAKPLQKKSGEA